jgi:hypothetical protein
LDAALSLGEPVYAILRLVNVGERPVEVFKLLDPQTGAIQIEVSSSNRPRFVFLPLFYADAVHTRTALAPGEAVVAVVPIFYGALGWTFDRPGTYRVTAEYRPQAGLKGPDTVARGQRDGDRRARRRRLLTDRLVRE